MQQPSVGCCNRIVVVRFSGGQTSGAIPARMCCMEKRQLSISEKAHLAVYGMGTVVLTLASFIVVLWMFIIAIRVVMG